MKIVILFGLLATAFSQQMLHKGFSNDDERENFKIFDHDLDGIIHLSELFTVFRTMDTNDDGVVSLQEFTNVNPEDLPPLQVQILFSFMDNMDSALDDVVDSSFICAYFSLLDVDNDRKATLGEYRNVSQQVHTYFKKELKDIAGC
ncbi:uncharacterized protein LOC112569525 [Pomacea canaliculata]|uniref:uncharacterized protein LOC112569525 n=1 Tax=Pomacea canaliculata TaxID=400727 RepID=UPI000D72FEED|nr:uncharacterized protein LOC112569525 [Pomacea canaliculata]